jgi:hypothetical protein
MSQQKKRKLRELCDLAASETDPVRLLNMFLELDRMVVERSMRLYKIPHRQRFLVREQNRRLHDAIRSHRGEESRIRKFRARA